MYRKVHPFFIGLSPDPSPVGRGVLKLLLFVFCRTISVPLPTGEGLLMLRLYALPAPQ